MKNAWVKFLVVFGQTGVYAGIESAIVAITGQLKKLMVAINAGEITRAFSQLKIEFEYTMLYLKGIRVLWLRFTALVLNTMVSIDKGFNVFFKLKQTFLNLKVAYLVFADVVMNWIAAFDRELTAFWNAWTYGSKKATASIQAYAAIVTAKLGDAIRASSKHWDEHRDGVDQTSKGLQELADKAKGAAKEATDEWEKGWSDFNNPIDEAIVSTKQLKNELTALEAVWVNSSGADEQITSLKFFDDFNNKRFMNEMGEMSRETKDITQLSADFIDGFSTGITDELAEALATGKMDFADFARSILMDINKMIIKMLIFKAIMGVVNAVGGMFGGAAAAGAPGASQAVGNLGSSGALSSASVFGAGSVASFGSSVAPSAFESAVGIGGNMPIDFSGAFAKGGSVSGGKAIIVGEQGREVFVPDSDGQIIPNHNINKTSSGQGSESGDTINVTLNLSTGVQQTVRAEVMGMMPVITKQVKGAVAEARQRGGSFSSQMGVV
jgi:hypothetical protein